MNFLTRARSGRGSGADRADGDTARDRREWRAAAEAYRRHLAGAPEDAEIWVQLGHALKEQDDLTAASDAYQKAVALRPADDDAANHLSHALKRAGRTSEAAASFARIYQRSGSREAYAELSGLPGGREIVRRLEGSPERTVAENVVFLEIDDVLGFLEAHSTVTGIQRVQTAVIRQVLSVEGRARDARHVFVLNPGDDEALWRLRDDDLLAIVDLLGDASVEHDLLKQFVARARRNATEVTPTAGQTLLVLGAFWSSSGIASRYLHLKRAGVRLGVYIYDLIPITHHEYCDQNLSHQFFLLYADALSTFDFFLAISEFTARQIRHFSDVAGLPAKPVEVVPLAHASSDESPARRPIWGRTISHLRDRPFVLMVSTLEARKNHAYLIAAWKAFLDEGLDPPDLVFVGRVGWRVSSLMELLEATRYFEGRIHVLHGLSDPDLDTLYSGCSFTAFPSFVEGWGLPVGESLAHGKPCVAFSTSAIPEVGGDLVDYLDPHNLRDGLAVLRRMAFDADYRSGRASEIKKRFRPRRWADVGTDLLDRVDTMAPRVKIDTAPAVFFPAGSVFRPSDLVLGRKLPKHYAKSPVRLMLGNSWHDIDATGAWMKDDAGSLTFRSDVKEGEAVVVYLVLNGGPLIENGSVTVEIEPDGDSSSPRRDLAPTPLRPGERFLARAGGLVGQRGLVSVRIKATGSIRKSVTRAAPVPHMVGLVMIGHAARGDAAGRIELQDAVLEAL